MKDLTKIILCAGLAFTVFGCAAIANKENTVEPTKEVEEVRTVIAGSYQDGVSQRASMEITENGDQAHIIVHWANSAEEETTWEMDAKQEGDKFVYTNCTKSVNGQIEYQNESGYFEMKDGKLSWSGASDTECRKCEFEKI